MLLHLLVIFSLYGSVCLSISIKVVVLVGGMDLSGNNYDENSRYIGIVIGTQEKINHIVKHLNLPQTSAVMDKSSANRNTLASKMAFDNSEIVAFCVKIDRSRIIGQIKKRARKQNRYFQPEKIWIAYNRLLLSALRDKITSFVNKHNHSIVDVPFQCDADCRSFIKENGLQHAVQGGAYMLSDILAWANNRGLEPRGTHLLDLTKELEEKLARKIL